MVGVCTDLSQSAKNKLVENALWPVIAWLTFNITFCLGGFKMSLLSPCQGMHNKSGKRAANGTSLGR